MNKKVVHYTPSELQLISKGVPALVFPVDHPSPLVSNTKMVKTSLVHSYNPTTGEFETLNTIYRVQL